MIKVAAGRMASKVVDCAIQVYGGAGVSDDFPLAEMWDNYCIFSLLFSPIVCAHYTVLAEMWELNVFEFLNNLFIVTIPYYHKIQKNNAFISKIYIYFI